MAATLPRINELKTLLFSLGIRAEDINDNFDLIRYWIESERLRTSGWGLVEGFDLSKELTTYNESQGYKYWDAKIHVSEGIMINRQGQEVRAEAHTFHVLPPVPSPVTETVTTDENGLLRLRYPIYSRTYHRTVFYMPSQGEVLVNEEELEITPLDEPGRKINLAREIEFIAEKDIKLVSGWANTEFRVVYEYADDRIDGIFLSYDGKDYQYERGIISTSPSEQVTQDYLNNGYYLIGFAYWHVGREVDVEFFTEGRTFRKVYTDRNNILYLNGKPYVEKTIIYFIEPQPPQENDLWYSLEDEILYIWRPNKNGKYEWMPVNDLSRSIVSAYTFPEEENPNDLQTFRFMPDLFYMPGQHQLTVIIDQIVIMEDQYDELYYGQDEVERLLENEGEEESEVFYTKLKQHACAYGFKLKRPLERPSVVEVRITHNLNTRRNDTDLFQHEAVFLMSGSYTVEDPEVTIYSTNCEYESGAAQLEIYKNGIRLINGIHYKEVNKQDGSDAETSGILCNQFRITTALTENDIIDFRVLRQMSSYANLKAVFREWEETLQDAVHQMQDAVDVFTEKSEEFDTTKVAHERRLSTAEDTISSLQDNKIDVTAKLNADNLTNNIRKGIISAKIEIERETVANDIFLPDITSEDYIVIAYADNQDDNPVLLSALRNDYALVDTDEGVILQLDNKWLSNANGKIYITGLRLGV